MAIFWDPTFKMTACEALEQLSSPDVYIHTVCAVVCMYTYSMCCSVGTKYFRNLLLCSAKFVFYYRNFATFVIGTFAVFPDLQRKFKNKVY